ncbi:cytochrome c1 [Methylocaldum szegediense]|uniref:Cytochrome c1 n=1 Tax=Methylocaldum szegediense TaxID=73780 RepID=A0ABN8X537_9GAMM|nr:cytochrome c1 [Methylocaldum szegediense]CAI8824597.1 Cytochrome c1 [Methylocaldum szegediense]
MRTAFGIALLLFSLAASATEPVKPLDDVDVDIFDTESVRRGAGYFSNYCMGCHSVKLIRYSRIGKDLCLDEDTMRREFMFGNVKIHDNLETAMSKEYGENAFGVAPPDLSLIVRARGADWVYSYLKGFYVDPKRPFGVNNLISPGVAMPNVLWALQGVQEPVIKKVGGEDRVVDARLVKKGEMSPKEFDQAVTDIVNFLAYVAEPSKLQRLPLGKYVLFFLVVLAVIMYRLKKEYWKDVH